MCWDKVTLPKEQGGLGFARLDIVNEALLAKWWWRFGNEKEALWRRVLDSKYGYSNKNWIPLPVLSVRGSYTWKGILNISNKVEVMKSLGIFPGNGKSTSFWYDSWVGNSPLNEMFPRHFRVSSSQDACVADMDKFVDNVWVWDITFRRRLFEWEKEILGNLLNCLNQIKIFKV